MGLRDLSAIHDQIIARIADGRWTVLATEAHDRPAPLSYTIGLASLGFPEAVIFGLPAFSAQGILNAYGQHLVAGATFADGDLVHDLASAPLLCVEGEHDRILSLCPLMNLQAVSHPGLRIRAVQLVWPDSRGRYPSEPGSDKAARDAQLPLVSGPAQLRLH